jgi:hypothetical protein
VAQPHVRKGKEGGGNGLRSRPGPTTC